MALHNIAGCEVGRSISPAHGAMQVFRRRPAGLVIPWRVVAGFFVLGPVVVALVLSLVGAP